jgi:hypothetical protein
LFIAVRPARSVLGATGLLGVFTAWFGMVEAPLPMSIDQGAPAVPIWRLLAMGAAVLPVLALHSSLVDLEVVQTRRLRAMGRRYLSGLGLGCAASYLGICALALDPSVVGIIARAWFAWFGLALMAGAALGWRLAWTMPSVVAVVLWYWGYGGDGRYRWWEFSARPHDDLPSLFLTAALLVLGLIAYWATPWRRRRWIFWRTGRPSRQR